jgi:hypothetical protein
MLSPKGEMKSLTVNKKFLSLKVEEDAFDSNVESVADMASPQYLLNVGDRLHL